MDDSTIINVETQTEEPYNGELWQGSISPDGTQVIINNEIIDIATGETVLESDQQVVWLADGTGYYIRSSNPHNTTIYNHDGSVRFSHDVYATVSQTGRWLGWDEHTGQYPETNFNFLIMNTETGQITELCTDVENIAFSPDDTQAAITTRIQNNQSRLWIIDLDTWQATPIDIHLSGSSLIGWWGL